jgi:hypothetical protein
MDSLTQVQIVVYAVGAFGLVLSFLVLKYGKPPKEDQAKK